MGKLGVNMNLWEFLGVICAKNLRESGISRPPWGAPAKVIKGGVIKFLESYPLSVLIESLCTRTEDYG